MPPTPPSLGVRWPQPFQRRRSKVRVPRPPRGIELWLHVGLCRFWLRCATCVRAPFFLLHFCCVGDSRQDASWAFWWVLNDSQSEEKNIGSWLQFQCNHNFLVFVLISGFMLVNVAYMLQFLQPWNHGFGDRCATHGLRALHERTGQLNNLQQFCGAPCWDSLGGFAGQRWPCSWLAGALMGQLGRGPHQRWSQAPPRPWLRPGSADITYQ